MAYEFGECRTGLLHDWEPQMDEKGKPLPIEYKREKGWRRYVYCPRCGTKKVIRTAPDGQRKPGFYHHPKEYKIPQDKFDRADMRRRLMQALARGQK